jgi:hypothetical protein
VPGFIVNPKRWVSRGSNAQSPSQRSDGDCALTNGIPAAPYTYFLWRRHRHKGTVAATGVAHHLGSNSYPETARLPYRAGNDPI